MQRIAEELDFPFPYLLDDTQAVAKAYGAVCTPDFFGYNAALELQYRGRLDASRKETAPEGTARDLYTAMIAGRTHRRGPGGADPERRLLDQVEDGVIAARAARREKAVENSGHFLAQFLILGTDNFLFDGISLF
jgi:hypothetical protein